MKRCDRVMLKKIRIQNIRKIREQAKKSILNEILKEERIEKRKKRLEKMWQS